MNMSPWTRLALATLALALPAQAFAEGRVCEPKVDWVAVDHTGSMLVALNGMGAATLCNMNFNLNTTRGAVTPATCQSWYAGFTTVRAKNTAVTMWFDFGQATAPQCEAIRFDWTVPATYPYLIAFH